MKKLVFFLVALGVFTWGSHALFGTQPGFYFLRNLLVQQIRETTGSEKRQVFQASLEGTVEQQKATNKEFKDALEELRLTYSDRTLPLADRYDTLSADYKRVAQKVSALKGRIDALDSIATRLFQEWKQEAESLTKSDLKATSLTKLELAQEKYKPLKASLEASHQRAYNTLVKYRDYVLTMKHSLNASAIDLLKSEGEEISGEFVSLINDMERSIQDTQSFMESAEFLKGS